MKTAGNRRRTVRRKTGRLARDLKKAVGAWLGDKPYISPVLLRAGNTIRIEFQLIFMSEKERGDLIVYVRDLIKKVTEKFHLGARLYEEARYSLLWVLRPNI